MAIIKITNENYTNEVLSASQSVLIDFWASWCGPCQMMSPVIEEIANEFPNIKVCKVNVDEQTKLSQDFKILSIPTLVLIKNGMIVKKSVGLISKDKIIEMIKI